MANGRFNAGDVVELKSGSVPMTVSSISEDGSIVCHYFDYTKHEMVTVTLAAPELKISPDA